MSGGNRLEWSGGGSGGGGRLWIGVGRVGRSEAASKDNDRGRRLLKGG